MAFDDRPRRADVAHAYDLGVDAYVALWSPVIAPPARRVVEALEVGDGDVVLDVGIGSGALVPAVRHAARDVGVVGIDPSAGMLGVARRRTAVPVVQADAVALPLRDRSVDAVVLAYVLFHLSDPHQGLREAARVVRAGGRVGIVTWMHDGAVPAYDAWSSALADAGAPPLAPRRDDRGLDSPEAIDSLVRSVGLRSDRTWREVLAHDWDVESYWQLTTGSGINLARLAQLDEVARSTVLRRVRTAFEAMPSDAFRWQGEVVCAVATLDPRSSRR